MLAYLSEKDRKARNSSEITGLHSVIHYDSQRSLITYTDIPVFFFIKGRIHEPGHFVRKRSHAIILSQKFVVGGSGNDGDPEKATGPNVSCRTSQKAPGWRAEKRFAARAILLRSQYSQDQNT
ncbi:hypothetical protein RUM44_013811 [Polyplax serrata]|uniref:Uncharacterized protein n=1 Tax=Polyplax serrata TaxID=468196 RepID=A0ABR1BF75_POLSC